MVKFEYKYHPLHFVTPSGTSRGILKDKPTWIIKLTNENNISGYGEVSIIEGLSIETSQIVNEALNKIPSKIQDLNDVFKLVENFPSIYFAFEQANLDLENGGEQILYRNKYSIGEEGILINGLVWMNPIDKMLMDAQDKIKNGFHCLKFKIGALNTTDEIDLLKSIRDKCGDDLEIRVDANGAFNVANVFQVMDELEKLNIHSIEQPIAVGQYELMRKVCFHNSVGVALDEELIGKKENRVELLQEIQPNYLILKPSLLGGFKSCDEWIDLAEKNNIGWWVTSALESNIGLNAIAQWVANKSIHLPQGLGTGGLFTNNFESPMYLKNDKLFYDVNKKWSLPFSA